MIENVILAIAIIFASAMIHRLLNKLHHHQYSIHSLMSSTTTAASGLPSSSTLFHQMGRHKVNVEEGGLVTESHREFKDLPCEVILYILEFYELPLHRYLYLLDGSSTTDVNAMSPRSTSCNHFAKLLYGYFNSPNSDTRREKRQVYLIFSYLEFRANNIRNVCDSTGRFITLETPVLKQVTPFRHVKGFDISHVETLYCFNINENLLYNFANTPAISLNYCNFEYNKLFHDGGLSLLVERCPNIERINVSKTSVTYHGILSIVKSLPKLRELCANHLENNAAKSGVGSVEELQKAQQAVFEYMSSPYRATRLERLELKRCVCTDEQIDSLLCSNKLTHLDLSFCNWLTSNAFKSLRYCSRLKSLNLSFTELDMETVKSLAENGSIHMLCLDSCSLGSEEMLALLSSTSRICKSLKHITLCRNRAIEGSYRQVLGNLKQLESIDLSFNAIQGDFIKYLRCDNLKHLDLHRCSLRDEDAKILFMKKSITSLDLAGNRFVDSSVFSFFSLMNHTIQKLNLSKSFHIHNREKRLQAIEQLMRHTSLVEFDFCGNMLTDEEAKIMLQSTTLQRLNINNNFLNGECLSVLKYDTDKLPSLRWLDMSNQHYDIKQDILVDCLLRSQEAHDIGYGLEHFSFSDQYLDNQVRSIIINRCTKITEIFIARDDGILNIHLQ